MGEALAMEALVWEPLATAWEVTAPPSSHKNIICQSWADTEASDSDMEVSDSDMEDSDTEVSDTEVSVDSEESEDTIKQGSQHPKEWTKKNSDFGLFKKLQF